jgi:hypothetical protein
MQVQPAATAASTPVVPCSVHAWRPNRPDVLRVTQARQHQHATVYSGRHVRRRGTAAKPKRLPSLFIPFFSFPSPDRRLEISPDASYPSGWVGAAAAVPHARSTPFQPATSGVERDCCVASARLRWSVQQHTAHRASRRRRDGLRDQ